MSDETLISYAQNGEDVVLWRALGHVEDGRYVDVGACDPVELSLTKALYDRGWRGIDIDPVPEYVERLSAARPGNEVIRAAITDADADTLVLHQLVGTGLSTLLEQTAETHEQHGFERRDIEVPAMTLDAVCERSLVLGEDLHLLKVDVEGAEAMVLRSIDLERWRPWVVVVEATEPLSTEPSWSEWDPILVEAGYVFRLFDGLSRFYSSPEHPELATALSYPACVLDDYEPVRQHRQDLRVHELVADVEANRAEVARWRREAVSYWANSVASVQQSEDDSKRAHSERDRMQAQLAKTRESLAKVRAERKRLRGRVERLSTRLEKAQQGKPGPTARDGVVRRARAALRGIKR